MQARPGPPGAEVLQGERGRAPAGLRATRLRERLRTALYLPCIRFPNGAESALKLKLKGRSKEKKQTPEREV